MDFWLETDMNKIFQIIYCILLQVKRLQKYLRPNLEVEKYLPVQQGVGAWPKSTDRTSFETFDSYLLRARTPERILDKFAKSINKTFAGWKLMYQGLRTYFV